MRRIILQQKRAIRILHSVEYRNHTYPLFYRYKVLNTFDLASIENCIFVNKCLNNEFFALFTNHFNLTARSHSYCTRSVSNGLMLKRLYNTIRYGNKSIINSTVSIWNHFQAVVHGQDLFNISPKRMKSTISKYCFDKYEE